MKIVIECESFEELFDYVKKIGSGVWDAPAAAPAEKKPRAKKSETTQALPTAAPAPAPEIMPAPTIPAPTMPVPNIPAPNIPAPNIPTPTITREACAKAAALLGRQGKITREQLRDLITSLGANSIPEIPEEKLPELADKIRALGGTV